jgi:hypothetical protein
MMTRDEKAKQDFIWPSGGRRIVGIVALVVYSRLRER